MTLTLKEEKKKAKVYSQLQDGNSCSYATGLNSISKCFFSQIAVLGDGKEVKISDAVHTYHYDHNDDVQCSEVCQAA
tara:strand:+ start:1806 stop:2036 length:231 start_codon:yes stop_codon:yes gene_type:complete